MKDMLMNIERPSRHERGLAKWREIDGQAGEMAVYAGFSAALNGLMAAKEVFALEGGQ
jgi:hypothetical protein